MELNNKNKFKAVLFDLDGTLLNTLGSIRHYVNLELEKYDITPITDEETKIFVGDGASALIERTMYSRGISANGNYRLFSEMLKSYVKNYNADPYPKTEPYDGIVETIRVLRDSGIALAVISNKPDDTVKQLVEYYFPNTFFAVVGARDGVALKPSPEAPLDICRQLGVLPEETIYVGDTGVDMNTGRAYGCGLNIGAAWGFRGEKELLECGADMVISSATDILKLL